MESSDHLGMIEESMERIARRRGVPFSEDHFDAIVELLKDPYWGTSLARFEVMEPDERDQWVEGLIRFAMVGTGETLPVPEAITRVVLSQTSDDMLAEVLYDFVCEFLSRTCGDEEDQYRDAILNLPRGLLIVYLLTNLDGEVSNGGFQQFFTNSSGEFVPETLKACTLAGSTRHREVLAKAIAVWEPARQFIEASPDPSNVDQALWQRIEEEVTPQLEELDAAYSELEDVESIPSLIAKYVRARPDECLLELPPL